MQAIEIILLVCGALAFVISFFLPDRGEQDEKSGISQEELRSLVDEEIAASRDRIEDMTEETMNYALEKAERSLDRISNEKMLALGEYSDNVLDRIGKNQQESVFLHDMLNKNKDELTALLNRADSASKDASLRANEAYDLAGSAKALAQEAYDQAATAGRHATLAESKMIDARKRLDTPLPVQEPQQAEAEPDDGEDTADAVIARAKAVAALRRFSAQAAAQTESFEEEAEEPALEAPESADTEPADAGSAMGGYPEEERAREIAEAEAIAGILSGKTEEIGSAQGPEAGEAPHRMTAQERIAAMKERSDAETAEADDDAGEAIRMLPDSAEEPAVQQGGAGKEEPATGSVNGEGDDVQPLQAVSAEAPETAKPKPRRTTRKTAAKPAAKTAKNAQMNLQDLMPKESVSLQFGAGNGPVNNNQKILDMHRMGRSNMAIAKELGLGLGEVKLVIDLFENS